MLAVLSAVAVIATSSIYSVSAIDNDLVEKIDVSESITTMKELEDSITYPVEISGEDELRLKEGLTIDLLKELLEHQDELPEYQDLNSYLASASISNVLAEYINTHDIYRGDVIFDADYYEGMLQIAESTTHIVYPTGWTKGDEYKIVEVPESITTMKEFKDYITQPVYISADDWLMLSYHLTIDELRELVAHFELNSDLVSDKLIKYFEENGLDEEQID